MKPLLSGKDNIAKASGKPPEETSAQNSCRGVSLLFGKIFSTIAAEPVSSPNDEAGTDLQHTDGDRSQLPSEHGARQTVGCLLADATSGTDLVDLRRYRRWSCERAKEQIDYGECQPRVARFIGKPGGRMMRSFCIL